MSKIEFIPNYLDASDSFLMNIYAQIQLFEKNRFKKEDIVKTKFESWSILLEENGGIAKCTPEEENSKIRLNLEFVKESFMFTEYVMRFYADKIVKDEKGNEREIGDYGVIFKYVSEMKKNFFSYSKDNKNWKKLSPTKVHKDIFRVYVYVFHFMLCHEMSHTKNPGESVEIEKECDSDAAQVLFEMADKILNSTEDGKEKKFLMMIAGGIIAQVIIAGKTKQNLWNTDEESPKLTHPHTYNRILNFIGCFDSYFTWKKITNNVCKEDLDNLFMYMLISMLFLYKFFNYGDFLKNNISIKNCCAQILTIISVFYDERNIEQILKKPRLCNDEFIGFVYWNDFFSLSYKRRSNYSKLFVHADKWRIYCTDVVREPIVVVLSFPQKKEFFSKGIEMFDWTEISFSRPMNGITRKFFERNLCDLLSHYVINADSVVHPVVIVNACMFQCTLGDKKSKVRRDYIKKMFELKGSAFGEGQLIERLRLIKPWMVINACSKDYSNNETINDTVSYLLFSNGFKYINCGSPKMWH